MGEVHRQMDAWRAAAGSGATSGGHLRLVTPTAGGSGTAAVAAAGNGNSSETQALKDRVKDLEGQLAESKRLIDIRNAELAELQTQARRAGDAAPPASPPPASRRARPLPPPRDQDRAAAPRRAHRRRPPRRPPVAAAGAARDGRAGAARPKAAWSRSRSRRRRPPRARGSIGSQDNWLVPARVLARDPGGARVRRLAQAQAKLRRLDQRSRLRAG